MKVKVKVTGVARARKRVRRVPSLVEMEMRKQVQEAAQEVMESAVKAIDAPKSGKLYNRRLRSRQMLRWRASAPGEAPARKTGENTKRIKVKKSHRAYKPGAKVAFPRIYRMLEQGMATKSILPRPLFGPVMKEFEPKWSARMRRAVKSVLGIAGRGG